MDGRRRLFLHLLSRVFLLHYYGRCVLPTCRNNNKLVCHLSQTFFVSWCSPAMKAHPRVTFIGTATTTNDNDEISTLGLLVLQQRARARSLICSCVLCFTFSSESDMGNDSHIDNRCYLCEILSLIGLQESEGEREVHAGLHVSV